MGDLHLRSPSSNALAVQVFPVAKFECLQTGQRAKFGIVRLIASYFVEVVPHIRGREIQARSVCDSHTVMVDSPAFTGGRLFSYAA